MPLLDHFRPPLADRRDWHSFHNLWAGDIAADLNARLPPEYFAEANVQYGIEIDAAVLEEPGASSGGEPVSPWSAGGVVAVPYTLETDVAEVRVYWQFGGRQFVGAVELASPPNKDRPESRAAFVAKCDGYLRGGAGVVVDVVTSRQANLHDELLAHIGRPSAPLGSPLYTVSYRALGANGDGRLEFLPVPLALGEVLPDAPLWLRGGPCVTLPLEHTYLTTCRESRIAV
jgi:hypothetical protein